ncbi:hypothetical protein Tco_0507901 [Tanacetum coccineum]
MQSTVSLTPRSFKDGDGDGDTKFQKDFSKSNPVTTQNVSNDFSKPITAQILPQNILPIIKNINVIAPGMYKVHTKPTQTRTPQLHQDIRKPNKRVSFSTGVIPNTRVSRPQLKSNHLEDRVMSNNSQGKNQEVEDHRRKFMFSNNKTFVTACNDSLNAKTSNVNFVCVTCGKCVLNDNHDLYVLHYINGMNSRTRQPMAVPVSTREPKQNVNQSVATDSTVKKFRNTTRKLYEQVIEPNKEHQEAMAVYAWTESDAGRTSSFDRQMYGIRSTDHFAKNVIPLKWLRKNKRDEENTVIRNKSRLWKGICLKEGIGLRIVICTVARLEAY